MSERWSAETEERVEAIIDDCACVGGGAQRVLEALADAGLLLPPGGETREEWGALDHGVIVDWNEDQARANVAWLRETDPDAKVMRRTVHTTPWAAISTEGDTDHDG